MLQSKDLISKLFVFKLLCSYFLYSILFVLVFLVELLVKFFKTYEVIGEFYGAIDHSLHEMSAGNVPHARCHVKTWQTEWAANLMSHKQTLGLLFLDPIEVGEKVRNFIGSLGGNYLVFFAWLTSASDRVLASIIVFRDGAGSPCNLWRRATLAGRWQTIGRWEDSRFSLLGCRYL